MGKDDDGGWIRDRLPVSELFFCRNEADYYGASWEIARALGRRRPGFSETGWLHGWPWMELRSPRQLVSFGEPDNTYLVPRQEHVEFLRRAGYPNAIATGLPLCYAGGDEVERRRGSLLVMPAHTTWAHRAQAWDEDSYARAIAGLRDRFESIVACVHSSCFRNGIWVNAFKRAGIPCLSGARTNDRNALRAQSVLFRSFEYVTGNQIGSWVAYGASLGAKVSIWGPPADYHRDDYARDRFMSENPELLELFLTCSRREALGERFPWLVVDQPDDAEAKRDWGEREVGMDCRRSADEIAGLLGWEDRRLQRRYRLRVLPRLCAGRLKFYAKNGVGVVSKRIRSKFR